MALAMLSGDNKVNVKVTRWSTKMLSDSVWHKQRKCITCTENMKTVSCMEEMLHAKLHMVDKYTDRQA